jgi:hypothetical protein
VEVGAGGEAEGVVERELGERHGGGVRRAERRLGGFSAVAPWMGVGRRGDVWVFGRIRGAGEGIFSQVRVHFLFEYSTVQSLAPFGLLPHVYRSWFLLPVANLF